MLSRSLIEKINFDFNVDMDLITEVFWFHFENCDIEYDFSLN